MKYTELYSHDDICPGRPDCGHCRDCGERFQGEHCPCESEGQKFTAWESMMTPEEEDLDNMLEEHRSGDHPNNHRCPYCKAEEYDRDMYERRIKQINQKAFDESVRWQPGGDGQPPELGIDSEEEDRIKEINQKALEKLEPLREALKSLDVGKINAAFDYMTRK